MTFSFRGEMVGATSTEIDGYTRFFGQKNIALKDDFELFCKAPRGDGLYYGCEENGFGS
jgi:hypothetical protein